MFAHDVLLEAIMTGNTDINVHDLKESLRKLDQIEHDSKVSGFEKKWKVRSRYVYKLQICHLHL